MNYTHGTKWSNTIDYYVNDLVYYGHHASRPGFTLVDAPVQRDGGCPQDLKLSLIRWIVFFTISTSALMVDF